MAASFLSSRVKNLNIGVSGYTNNTDVLDVIGNITSSGSFTSTIPDGTAPLQVNSTTLVENLNVDLLDNQQGTYYLDLDNATGTLDATKGGTGLSTYAKGDILYSSSSNTLSSLAIGNTGNILTVDATGVPVWKSIQSEDIGAIDGVNIQEDDTPVGLVTVINFGTGIDAEIDPVDSTIANITVDTSGLISGIDVQEDDTPLGSVTAINFGTRIVAEIDPVDSTIANITFTDDPSFNTVGLTVADGTAPLTVTSTTLVSNLNADLLDNQQGTYYLDLDNATGTLADDRLSGTYTGVSFNSTGSATFTSFSGSGALLTNIPNAALDNSTVSYGGVTLSLGGSDATPAFDLQDATGLPVSTGISGLGANVATFLTTPSSENLRTAVTDETGSGALVFSTSPTLVTPTLGVASATSIDATGIITATTFYAPGGTFSTSSESKTNSSIVIDENSAIYTLDNSEAYLRVLIEKNSDIINIGQLDTALIDGIELRPGSAGSVKLHHGGTTDNVKLQTTSYGIYVTGVDANTSTIGGAANLVLDPAAVGDNTGTVTILGNLQVEGTTTTINSTTLEVEDKDIVLALNAADSAAANGAGIIINGASATLTYASTGDKWVFNKAPYYNTDRLLTTADEGSGNGLDADTLDGIEASSFLRSDAADIATGNITFQDSALYFDNTTFSTFDWQNYQQDAGKLIWTVGGTGGAEMEIESDGVDYTNAILLVGGSTVITNANKTTYISKTYIDGLNINADTVDGLDASQFLRSDADDTATGLITLTNGLNVTIGNVGIGTDNPAAKLDVNGTIAFNSTLTAGQNGKIIFPDNTSVPDNPTNEQYDYITFGANGSISQVSGRGALMITSSDDSLILANGDVGRSFTSSNINVNSENIILLSDGNVTVKTDLQNGWGTENDYVFSGGDIEATTFTSTQTTGTSPFTVSSTTVVTNLNADLLDNQQGTYYLDLDNATGTLDATKGGTGLSTYAKGDIIYSSAANTLEALTLGTENQLLTVDATGVPVWKTVTAADLGDIAGVNVQEDDTPLGLVETINFGTGILAEIDPVDSTIANITVDTSGLLSGIDVQEDTTPLGSVTTINFGDRLIATLDPVDSTIANITFTDDPSFNTIELTVANGTAPLTVTSTTLVSNLNADLLDNQQGTYYLDLDNATNILDETKGGTSLSTYTTGDILYASATDTLSALAVGTENQVLTVDSSGVPVWKSLDASVTGSITISNNTLDQSQYLTYAVSTGNTTELGVTTEGLVFNPFTGRMGIGQTLPQAKLDINVGTGLTALNIEGSEGQLFSVTNNLTSGSIFSVNDVSGVPSIDVDADGTIQLAPFGSTEYVGIGTTSPTQKLDVNGNIRLRGALYDNSNSIGATNQVLTSTGSGISWQDAAVSGVDIQSDGTPIGTGFTTLNFIGEGNNFAVNGTTVDINIAGGSSTPDISPVMMGMIF